MKSSPVFHYWRIMMRPLLSIFFMSLLVKLLLFKVAEIPFLWGDLFFWILASIVLTFFAFRQIQHQYLKFKSMLALVIPLIISIELLDYLIHLFPLFRVPENELKDTIDIGVLCLIALPQLYLFIREVQSQLTMDQTLKERQEMYKALFENNHDAVYMLDAEGCFKAINPAAEILTGHCIEEWVGKSFLPLIVEKDLSLVQEKMRSTLSGQTERYEIQLYHKNGNLLDVQISSSPIIIDGEIKGLYGLCKDLTMEKNAERRRKEWEEQSIRIYNLLDNVGIWTLDGPTKEITFCSNGFEDIYGYSFEEFKGNLELWEKTIHPEDHARIINSRLNWNMRTPLETGFRITRKDGTIRWIRDRIYPIYSNADVLIRYEGVTIDITNEIESSKLIQRKEEQFRIIYNALDVGIWLAEANPHKLLFISEGMMKIYQRPIQDFFEKDETWFSVIYPEDQGYVMDCMKKLQEGMIGDKEYRIIRPDGTIRHVLDKAFPLRDEYGKITRLTGVVIDITEDKKNTLALKDSEERYRKLVEFLPIAFVVHTKGVVQYINDPVTELFGKPRKDIIGSGIEEAIHLEDRISFTEQLNQKNEVRTSEPLELRLERPDKQIRIVEATSIHIEFNGDHSVFTVFRDVTAQKNAQEKINYLAYHDLLTKLPNRVTFEKTLLAFTESDQERARKAAVVYVDLDRFKWVNDTLGHEMGDLLLTLAANRLKNCVTPHDLVARQGGDEFVIILMDPASVASVKEVASKILDSLAQPFFLVDHKVQISSSIGIAMYPENGVTKEELMRNADAALYRVKDSGRNGYSFFTSDLQKAVSRKVYLENGIRKALEEGEFTLYYQPQFDIRTNEMVGVEALIRWNHPDEGRLIPPGEFIPIAEETGLIIPVGNWVLREACRQAKDWQERGFKPLKICVNLSARQFQENDFISVVKTILEETGLGAKYLDLEITESIAIQGIGMVIEKLQQLNSMGISVSIDDFGTGFSSLSYLKQLPIQTLKIAQQFVRDLVHDPDDKSIVTSVIAMAKSLHLEVIAEGVETVEQLEFLRSQDCHFIQGYLFAKPLETSNLENYLRKRQIDGRL